MHALTQLFPFSLKKVTDLVEKLHSWCPLIFHLFVPLISHSNKTMASSRLCDYIYAILEPLNSDNYKHNFFYSNERTTLIFVIIFYSIQSWFRKGCSTTVCTPYGTLACSPTSSICAISCRLLRMGAPHPRIPRCTTR